MGCPELLAIFCKIPRGQFHSLAGVYNDSHSGSKIYLNAQNLRILRPTETW